MLRDWGLAESVGPIREVNAYSRKNYWIDKPLVKGSVIPKTLDWDLYLNRAEMIYELHESGVDQVQSLQWCGRGYGGTYI